MSLQWGIVAGFLYLEIFVLLILLLPGISPQRWLRVFRSRILCSLGAQTQLYFYGLFGLLCILFVDAIREMTKYAGEEYDLNVNPKAEMQAHMKLFRAQRNFYISGFALLMALVIRRITTLLSTQGSLMSQNEAVLKQASSSSAAAMEIMKQVDLGGPTKEELEKLQTLVNTLKEDNITLTKDRDAMQAQALSVSEEYDRILKEHEKLQQKVERGGGDKKDD